MKAELDKLWAVYMKSWSLVVRETREPAARSVLGSHLTQARIVERIRHHGTDREEFTHRAKELNMSVEWTQTGCIVGGVMAFLYD
ncbi:MAG: hypothetical protein ACYC36_02475 [Bellilinea sp.]